MHGPSIRTVLDMGGQDCKVIKIDDKGKVVAFLMNDKCAAGTGRGRSFIPGSRRAPPVNSTCVVFAKSEAAGLLRAGWPKEKVLAAYRSAMAYRVLALLEKINVKKNLVLPVVSRKPGCCEAVDKKAWNRSS
jgi:activator of 2-hydroxyglutaryl-CoA dehydratase